MACGKIRPSCFRMTLVGNALLLKTAAYGCERDERTAIGAYPAGSRRSLTVAASSSRDSTFERPAGWMES